MAVNLFFRANPAMISFFQPDFLDWTPDLPALSTRPQDDIAANVCSPAQRSDHSVTRDADRLGPRGQSENPLHETASAVFILSHWQKETISQTRGYSLGGPLAFSKPLRPSGVPLARG